MNFVEDVVAEGAAQQFALLGLFDGFAEVAGRDWMPRRCLSSSGISIDVLLDRRRALVALLDAFEAGRQHHGEGQVRVAGRVGARYSMRVAFSLPGLYSGTRTRSERLRRAQER